MTILIPSPSHLRRPIDLSGYEASGVRFSLAKRSDRKTYNALLDRSWDQHRHLGSTPPLLDAAGFGAQVDMRRAHLLLRGGVAIGGGLVMIDGDHLYLELLFLRPEAQSSKAFEAALDILGRAARDNRLVKGHFHTNEVLEANRALYRMMGAREVGRSDGGGFTRVHYAVDIAP